MTPLSPSGHNRWVSRLAAVILVAAAGLTACGGGSSNKAAKTTSSVSATVETAPTASSADSPATAATASTADTQPTASPVDSAQPEPTTHAIPDACTLITQPEAATASGTPVDPGINDTIDFTGLGTGTSCVFRVANSTVPVAYVRLNLIDLGADPAGAFASWKAYTGFAGGPVSGVGEDNFYSDAPGPVNLFIRTGNILIGINVLTEDGLAQATTLAKIVLSRIS